VNFRRVVTIGGPPGSGKSTAGRRVAAALGLEYVSAGDRFRAEAARRGMSLEAFGRFAEAHPEVDRDLDRAMQAMATPGRLVDGRIQGALCRRAGRAVLAIEVTAREDVRARRVAGRDGATADEALRAIRAREASERARYLAWYGIDLAAEPAELVVDSSERDADAVTAAITEFLRRAEGAE
jgi:CMP/dCMP kinase